MSVTADTIVEMQQRILTAAVLSVADRLEYVQADLARLLGVSEEDVSRMRSGDFKLQVGTMPFGLGVMLVKLFHSLNAIVGGDEVVARSWLASWNLALDATPAEKIRTAAGLTEVNAYLLRGDQQ